MFASLWKWLFRQAETGTGEQLFAPDLHRVEYRSTRPVTEPLSHAGSCYFPTSNIQASRPSFGAALRLVIPTF
jgi:hypothetical protein